MPPTLCLARTVVLQVGSSSHLADLQLHCQNEARRGAGMRLRPEAWAWAAADWPEGASLAFRHHAFLLGDSRKR